jgi:hypothetical protein
MGLKAGMKLRLKTASAALSFKVLTLAAAFVAMAASAAPAEKYLAAAGPVPTEIKLRAAILKYLQTTDRALDKRKPFKVLSGPTLATGNTFGGSQEQAWLMCVVVNAEKIGPGPQDIEGRSLYVRTSRSGEVLVAPTENWKDSSPKC